MKVGKIDLSIGRFAHTPLGTFGSMKMPDGAVLYTVERPWLDNKPSVSCIPDGKYNCQPRRFFRGGYDAVEITGVKGRSHILFHIANTMNDVEGCVGVGSKLGAIGQQWAVLASKQAFEHFMSFYGGRKFTLLIENVVYAFPEGR
jgi:hypothetical protein